MPWTRLRFDVVGDILYSRAFEAYAHEVDDMTEPLGEVAELIRLSVSEQFRTEGIGGLGRRWQALDPDYARWKDAAVGAQPILVFTGDMRAEMTARRAFTISPRRLVYEPNDPKALWHHTGAGDLPERPIVGLNDGERRNIDRIFATWLNTVRRGKPFGVAA